MYLFFQILFWGLVIVAGLALIFFAAFGFIVFLMLFRDNDELQKDQGLRRKIREVW